ncbi:YtjB family periplasmic protein [Xenorhabdus szentirmaii]|uniref:Protein smp n=2 Tax=Xenorhabdus szentirmaii TaxID=290112 RepID=W1J0E1_9GAMM|nr:MULTISPECIES: YtjB family periplasmic protein [Xenorhabdus]MBD2779575.1 YtjB family periplasmic protein [Xenorhabdus sp. 38]MBD2792262.1 YtjB family periplasmic protein [Xenorhabdus sp. CUL]MBD2801290.1 YtjB family periplasmic protein [Xenorhabdus sp. M]MBD2803935.1 YtjB family periplasmic protein [Xenorhabdus sp. ZM]MBD2821005.1 YtjB family periplasmic protein [Xenorhabdus sp. 42]
MIKAKLKFRLHKTAIILICITLLVLLMQGVSYFSRSQQQSHIDQFEDLAKTLAKQVAFSLSDYMENGSKDLNNKKIVANLDYLTSKSRILDASVYLENGTQIARSGEPISVRERLSLDGKKSSSFFSQQIVVPIPGENHPKGFLRLTLDTHRLATEAKQVDNTTNLLRIMLLLSLAIGFILAHNLLQLTPSRWQQSPYLLTANTKSSDEAENKGNDPER